MKHRFLLVPAAVFLAALGVRTGFTADEQNVPRPAAEPSQKLNVMWRFDGNAHFPNITPPRRWQSDSNILWRTPVGAGGYSSPIVVRDKVFVTAEMGNLVCLNLTDGRLLWTKDLFSRKSQDIPAELTDQLMRGCGGESKQSTPTPTSNGQHVFYINAMGLCACYDVDGTQQWIRIIETAEDEELFTASPIFAGDRIVVSWGCLLALDARDGSTLWKAEDVRPTHGTPAITTVGGTQLVVSPGGDIVRLRDGEILCSGLVSSACTTPLVEGNRIYVIDAQSAALELPAKAEKEMPVKEVWRTKIEGEFMASPVYHDGLLYSIESRTSRLVVIDAKTGENLYRNRAADRTGQTGPAVPGTKIEGLASARYAYASPTAAGQNIFFFDDAGNTAVVEPGRQLRLAHLNRLDDALVGTPFFIDDKIIVRGSKTVCCIAAKP
jgi:hypothetical protein